MAIWKVLIAHANGEEKLAEKLAQPIREIGYEVAHMGTVLVGESVVEEASKILNLGGPVVLCGTVRAVGTQWARRVINATRSKSGSRIFFLQMEDEADVESLAYGEVIGRYWENPQKAISDLSISLQRHFPLSVPSEFISRGTEEEIKYFETINAVIQRLNGRYLSFPSIEDFEKGYVYPNVAKENDRF
jgi:hypothetical protein